MKNLWDKIKPLNYIKNPIGSLKLEISFWINGLIILSYFSGSVETIKIITNIDVFVFPFWVVVILAIVCWLRISTLVSKHLKEKDI